jgi:dihydroorotate dehydrogenase (fumarate)
VIVHHEGERALVIMRLTTKYLGLTLKNPFIVGASPFCQNLSLCRELADAGASAIVMNSLFEEQLGAEQALPEDWEANSQAKRRTSDADFPHYTDYHLNPEHYLRQLVRLRELVDIPIIASLNGRRLGGWVSYAQRMEDAGAAALELNLYQMPSDPSIPGDEIEADMLQVVHTVSSSVQIPVAVKLSPFHSSLAHFAARLNENGAAGITLFNRLHQPDFDLTKMEKVSHLRLSEPSDLLMRLRWLSIISPDFPGALACSGGVHQAGDAAKALLAGADVVQVVSTLLKNGTLRMRELISGLECWMDSAKIKTVDDMRGRLSARRMLNPAEEERADYLRILQAWQV